MKKVFAFICIIIVLGFLVSGVAGAQSLEEIKAQARAQVRSEMGLDQPQPRQQQKYVQQVNASSGMTRLELIQQVALILVLLAFIPATIAKIKGRSFIAWWILGFLCFIVVFPAAIYMKKLTGGEAPPQSLPKKGLLNKTGVYEKIENLSKLKEKGILSSDEFEDKKRELLARL